VPARLCAQRLARWQATTWSGDRRRQRDRDELSAPRPGSTGTGRGPAPASASGSVQPAPGPPGAFRGGPRSPLQHVAGPWPPALDQRPGDRSAKAPAATHGQGRQEMVVVQVWRLLLSLVSPRPRLLRPDSARSVSRRPRSDPRSRPCRAAPRITAHQGRRRQPSRPPAAKAVTGQVAGAQPVGDEPRSRPRAAPAGGRQARSCRMCTPTCRPSGEHPGRVVLDSARPGPGAAAPSAQAAEITAASASTNSRRQPRPAGPAR